VHESPIGSKGHRGSALDRCRPQRRAIAEGKIRCHALARGTYPGTRLPRQLLGGVRSMGFWDAVGQQDWGLEWHRNDGIEICLLETGTMPFAVAQHEYVLAPGQLTITRPWQAHVLGAPYIGWGRLHWIVLDVQALHPGAPWRWPEWIVLSPADQAELTRRLQHCARPVWRAAPAIVENFQHLAAGLTAPPRQIPYSALAIHINHLLLNLLTLLRQSPISTTPSSQIIERVDQTVSDFLKELQHNALSLMHRWSVTEMARHCGMGVTTFTDCCRRITNTTPSDYLLRCRLQVAAEMIRQDPHRKIVEIALRCGFSTGQYFATRFQQHFGCSPSAYRQNPSPRAG